MSLFQSMDISATGLTLQRLRMDVISQNIANVNTTKTEKGTAYKRKIVLAEEKGKSAFAGILDGKLEKNSVGSGVKATGIVDDPRPLKKVYDPGHPDADEDGYVEMPNVNIIEEMVNMISANRSYEANVTSLNTTKSMAMKALEIGK